MPEKNIILSKIKLSLEDYKPFFEASPISITLLDLNGKIIETNSVTKEIAGKKREDLIGKNFIDISIIPSENLKNIIKILQRLKEGKIFGPKDIQIYDIKGNLIWINIIASLVKIGEIQLIQVLTQDITSKKNLELELKKSEENYRILTESANDLITVVNSEMIIEYINERIHQKIVGYTKKDLLGQHGLSLVHSDDREKVLLAFKKANKDGEGAIDARIKNKNGTYIWIEFNGKIIKSENAEKKLLIIGRDITEKVKYIKKLKESKDRYQKLANSLPQAIFEIDLDYKITYTNSTASKIFGYSHEEFKKGMKIFQFLAAEDKDLILGKLKHLLKGEYVKPLIVRLKRKDGTYFYSNIYAWLIFKEKKVVGIRSIIHDITAMKEAEEKLKESERKFKTIAEQSLLGICIIQDEYIKYINHTLANLLGYTVQEVLKWKQGEFFKTIHPEDKKKVIILATKKDSEFKHGIRYYESRGIKKNGDILWLEVYYKKIIYQKKPAFLVSFMDISERKKTQEKLKESEEKYRFLFEKAPFSLLLIDKLGKIVDCNPSLVKLLDYERNELIGKKFINLPTILKKYLPVLLEYLQKVGEGKSIPSLDLQLYKKSGALIWVNIEFSLVKIGDNNFIIVMGHDISEKKEAEKKLTELDDMRKEFINRASHELKTPITTIYGAYQLLNKFHKQKLDKNVLEIFEIAFSGTKRLKKLVDDLLDLSRLESKMFKLEKRNIDLTKLIKNCVNEIKYLIKSKNQIYELVLPNSLYVNVDDSRMELVLNNLLANAIKYTPAGGQITIKLEKLNKSAQISIKDTGIGFTKDELDKLFKKFSKIQRPMHKDPYIDSNSTGLGLYIAKEIVELHDGNIWVESEGRYKGSIFFIRIPIE